MKRSLLILFLFLGVYIKGQNTWEPTWGPNYNTVYYLHKMGSYIFMTTEFSCYRSSDGVQWEKLNIPNTYANYNVLHFNSCKGRLFGAGSYSNLIYSDDQGLNWQQDTLQGIQTSYVKGDSVYMASYRQLYFSPDSGRTWQIIVAPLPNTLTVITGMVIFQNKLYISFNNGEVYNSADNGVSWQLLSYLPVLSGPGYSYEDNNLVNDKDSMLYLSNFAGLFRTPSENSAWQDITPSAYSSSNCLLNYRIFGSTLLFGGRDGSFIADKTTLQWQPFGSYFYVSDILQDGTDIYAGTQDGLYHTSDKGLSWNKLFKGISPGVAVGDMFVNGDDLWARNNVTPDNGDTWMTPFADTAIVVSYNGSVVVMTPKSKSYYWAPPLPYYASSDNGLTWNQLNFPTPDIISSNKTDLYACQNGAMYKSSDLGSNWQQIDTAGYHFFLGLDSIIFIVRGDGVFKSYDDGATWVSCNNGIPPPDPGWIVWNGTDLFLMNIAGHIYRSADKGNSWQQLPETGITISMKNSMAASADQLFISGYSYGSYGSEVAKGIFVLNIGDSVWSVLNNDSSLSPGCMVVKDNYLFAGIGSEGVMRLKLWDEASAVSEYKNTTTEVKLFPNPSDTKVVVKTKEEAVIVLLDNTGREISRRSFSSDHSFPQLSTEGLPNGLYFIRIDTKGSRTLHKLIVAH